MQIKKNNQTIMLLMSKQGSLPEIGLILQKMNRPKNFNFYLTHWLQELFAKGAFLVILVIFRLDLSQITFDPVKNVSATQQLAFLATSSAFSALWLKHAQKSKFWDSFWTRKWPTSLGFSIFEFYFSFPFLFFLLQWLAFYWACLQLKNF